MSKNTIKNYFQKNEKNVLKRVVVDNDNESPSSSKIRNVEKTLQTEHLNDIANFCKKNNEKEKYEVLKNAWMPDTSFNFPSSGNRNLKFQYTWLNSFSWLLYSPSQDSAYCRFCVAFFCENVGRGNHQKSNFFVQTPFKNWKNALEKFREHQAKEYHKTAVTDSANFKLIYENKKKNILCEIDTGRKIQQHENREKLTSIIRAVLICGRQGIALRSHRDHGPLSLTMPFENDGNFRALLRLAIDSGDEILKKHIQTAAKNATYISWRIQNEIIEIAGELLQQKIVDHINISKCFSIIADESTDISGIEQFSICIRYVSLLENEQRLREDFLCFVPVDDTTGIGLANVLINKLKELNLNLSYLRGQGYDGARSMSGHFKGCAAVIQELYPEAVYVHCANHSLNLAIAGSCKIPAIRNCLGTIKETVNLFRLSSKAGKMLKNNILDSNPTSKQCRLLKFCETRWTEHLDSLSLFFDVFQNICEVLEQLDNDNLRCDVSKPHALLAAIRVPQFIIAIAVLKPIFALSKNLSMLLQQKDCDLNSCIQFANNLIDEVNDMREDSEQSFKLIFTSVEAITTELQIEIKIPRLAKIQNNRDNYEGSPEEYYRRSIYIPFLDHFLDQLRQRFSQHSKLLSKIENILPKKCVSLNDTQMLETCNILISQWPSDIDCSAEELLAEFKMWKRHCLNQTERPDTFIENLNLCEGRMFPSVKRCLQIGATLPVSVATSERSFSSLRRLKSYLRSTTTGERLNGLALLNVHRDIDVTVEEIVNEMAKKQRKIGILL